MSRFLFVPDRFLFVPDRFLFVPDRFLLEWYVIEYKGVIATELIELIEQEERYAFFCGILIVFRWDFYVFGTTRPLMQQCGDVLITSKERHTRL